MAYVSQEIISKARVALKDLNKEYGVKATLSGKGTSSLHLKISEGKIDFVSNHCKMIIKNGKYILDEKEFITYLEENKNVTINHYYIDHAFDSIALEYLEKAKAIMMVDHFDYSDIQSDYFNCAFYINMRIGTWDKPYVLVS